MINDTDVFNPPPGWQLRPGGWVPPHGWVPPGGWTPDPSWPSAPAGWNFWVPVGALRAPAPVQAAPVVGKSDNHALQVRIAELEAEVEQLKEALPVDLDDQRVLQEVGIYRYHHPLENASEYKGQLEDLSGQIKELAKSGEAVLASELFTFNNSLAKGRKMTLEFSKLMLRAYNAEADNCVRTLRAGNVVTAKRRLDSSVAAVAKLGSMMEMRINPRYHDLRFRELEMTADYLMKLQVEKEQAREERQRLREEAKAAKELAAERERLDKQRSHYLNAIAALASDGDQSAIGDLEAKLDQVNQAIEHNDFRAANIRAGYVYVISNPGAFGTNIVKIGLTRRLEPMDRVRELGGASVPFPFDVHALFFADDAVTVETELHHAFAPARVNHVNQRREFFFATPHQVRAVLMEKVGNLLEFTEEPEATQFLQSKKYWPTS